MRKLAPSLLLVAASCSNPHEPGQFTRNSALVPASSLALLGGIMGRAGGALTATSSATEIPPPPPDTAADPQPTRALTYQPVLQTQPAAKPALPLALQAPVCTSQQIRAAMVDLERAASQDRNGAALQSLVHAVTGVDASSGAGKVIDSAVGSDDDGRYTAAQPGSFICRGVFTRENARAQADTSSAPAGITAAFGNLMAPPPNFVENFLVQPLQSDSFRLTLVPSTIDSPHPYSTDFSVPASHQAG